MTLEKMLFNVNEIINVMKECDSVNTMIKLQNLKKKLESDIELSETKKAGKTNILSAFKYVLKNVPKEQISLKKIVKSENGELIVCDSYNLIVYSGELPIEYEDESTGYINYKPFIPNKIDSEYVSLTLPTISQLKCCISEAKAKPRKRGEKITAEYDFGDEFLCTVNAEYLKNAITAGVTKLYINERKRIFYGYNDDDSLFYLICGMRRANHESF